MYGAAESGIVGFHGNPGIPRAGLAWRLRAKQDDTDLPWEGGCINIQCVVVNEGARGWIARVPARRPRTTVVLDVDSGVSETHGAQCSLARAHRLAAEAPCGRPSQAVRRYSAIFHYQPASWSKARRVVVKVEWHPGELHPRVGFIVTNMARPPERVTRFCNQRRTAERYIKEGKNAVVWTRLSCRRFAANAVRLQLHALAYNFGNFLRTLTLPGAVSHWSMTTLRDRLVKIGTKIVRHGRSITFQMAEVMVPRTLFQQILDVIAMLRPAPPARC